MMPLFGFTMAKVLFAYMYGDSEYNGKTLRSEANFWCLMMLIEGIVVLFSAFGKLMGFGVVGENITLNMRSKLYRAIIQKDIGWFDDRKNAPGVLTSVLASDVQKLNGASTEGVSVITESCFALICGVVLGFIFEWRLTLVALACVPFMMFGGAMNSKLQ